MTKESKKKSFELQSRDGKSISGNVFRETVFDILRKNTNSLKTSFSLSSLQSATEKQLRLSKDSLKGANWREKLLELLDNFNSIFQSTSSSSSSSSPSLSSGKFSSSESSLILSTVQDYLSENELDYADIIPELRPAGSKSRQRHNVWNHLEALLPHRARQTIMQHAIRKLAPIAGMHYGWDEEDKEKLLELVNTYDDNNVKWIEIGREMNRLADECKSCYSRLSRDRKNVPNCVDASSKGKRCYFTHVEDLHIFQSICQNCRAVNIRNVSDIPMKDLPWKAISITFDESLRNGTGRTGKDLSRRWPTVRALIYSNCGNNSTKTQALEFLEKLSVDGRDRGAEALKYSKVHNDEHGSDALRIFQHIKLLDAHDDSEVVWTDVDYKLCLPYSTSRRTFKNIKLSIDNADELSFPEIVDEGLNMIEENMVANEGRLVKKRRREVDAGEELRRVNKVQKKEKKKKDKKKDKKGKKSKKKKE